jgi:hypothetical protein
VIAVVHLVWGPLGPQTVHRFLGSYDNRSAGVDHELVVALNGMNLAGAEGVQDEIESGLLSMRARTVSLRRPLLDLAAYLEVAAQLDHDRVCFLNSHSELLGEQWLAKLDEALDERGAGIVGASGSWFSPCSWAAHSLGLPSAYRGIAPPRAVAREQFAQIDSERGARDEGVEAPGRVRGFLQNAPVLPMQLAAFPPFPCEHLRTNAIMVRRELIPRLHTGRLASKMDTYRLESGRSSLTRQVRAMGMRALVVDRRGRAWEPRDWYKSCTLWQGDQEGLLVADNQTRLYSRGGVDRRRLLSTLAWGELASPTVPECEPGRIA